MAKGLELANRAEFESDVKAALRTAQAEWRDRMATELDRCVEVWIDDAIQLTAGAVEGAAAAAEGVCAGA
eukprot:401546-Prymnesium_polylepis.1